MRPWSHLVLRDFIIIETEEKEDPTRENVDIGKSENYDVRLYMFRLNDDDFKREHT